MECDAVPTASSHPEEPAKGAAAAAKRARSGPPKLKPIDRDQGVLRMIVTEELVPPGHKVRAIWEVTGRLNLGGFLKRVRSAQHEVGRAAWDPRLLLSIWLYAYSEGIASARRIEEMMNYEPGLMWLAGLGVVNHHTLSDFRTAYGSELQELFAELLAQMEEAGLVRLDRLMVDGTKIRAQAGADTFRREATIASRLEQARQLLQELETAEEDGDARRRGAQRRAHEEMVERLERAQGELEKLRAGKQKEAEKSEVRVSVTEPEARIMKHADGAVVPSYNVQVVTDAAEKVIVSCEVNQCSSDAPALAPALDRVKENTGRYPAQAVADGGYYSEDNLKATAKREIEFISSPPDTEKRQEGAMKAAGIAPEFAPRFFILDADGKSAKCPAGRELRRVGQSRKRGRKYVQYQAQVSDCQACGTAPSAGAASVGKRDESSAC